MWRAQLLTQEGERQSTPSAHPNIQAVNRVLSEAKKLCPHSLQAQTIKKFFGDNATYETHTS